MSEENVRVVVRIRPLSKNEVDKGCQKIAQANIERKTIRISNPADDKTTMFSFDAVFQEASQAEVYNEVARPLVVSVLEGYNATIFAYGQTGTGKTFTMEGEPSPELKGIIPNSFAQIFTSISKASEDTRFLVRVSHLEIYNEEVRDLLSKNRGQKLEVKEASDRGVYVKGLSSFVVRNAADMDKIMAVGNRNRIVASTNMNAVSSRSHAIFSITVECSTEVGASIAGKGRSIRMGKLNLVDLAGSERLGKTGATGKRLKEATKINWSLSNLGNVISALVDGSSHVPYRNSKLTRLLQDSLGGNAKTVMIANVGPADYNYEETLNTLRYAHRAKSIKNHACINEDPKDALLRQFENEIEQLRKQLEEAGDDGQEGSFLIEGMRMPSAESDGEDADDDGIDEEDGPMPTEVTDILVPAETEEALSNIKGEIENQQKITSSFGEVAQHKREALNALKEHVKTWKVQEEKKKDLQERMKSIRKQILVGGENLLDKSQQQEELLQLSMQELELKKEQEVELVTTLESKKAETAEAEEKIAGLQEQGHLLNKKLKKVWNQYHAAKTEYEQVQQNYQKETEQLVEDVQKMTREVQYLSLIIDSYIPGPYQSLIEENCSWNEDIGEWSLNCIAYSGNNVKRYTGQIEPEEEDAGLKKSKSVDLSRMYLQTEIEDPQPSGSTRSSSVMTRTDDRPVTRAASSAASRRRPQTSRTSMRW